MTISGGCLGSGGVLGEGVGGERRLGGVWREFGPTVEGCEPPYARACLLRSWSKVVVNLAGGKRVASEGKASIESSGRSGGKWGL